MKLTKGEYCGFNLKSRINLLKDHGSLLIEKKIDETYKVKLFSIYDFYVEVFYNYKLHKTLRVEPIINLNLLDFYLGD